MTNNIISHNCVGARICQVKNMEYGNPFMWGVIPPDDFYYLYTHYDSIDYKNIKIEKERGDYKIVIDEKVNVYYVHYKYDANATTPIKKSGIDVYYNKIEDYILEKYNKRLERMKDKPVFVVTDREFSTKQWCNFKSEDLKKYVNKLDCIVVTCDTGITGGNVIYVPNKKLDPKDIANKIIKEKVFKNIETGNMNICIVHYNTPEMTECLVKSINKFVKKRNVENIYIFDNSDKKPFTYRQDNIRYIDNTEKQIIDFEEWGKNYPDKMEPFYSSKHSYTVQTFMEMINEPFILLDSDILLKCDISDIWDESLGFVGDATGKRILPFICFINPRILSENGVAFFDDRFTYDLNKDKTGIKKYDTGYPLWANRGIIPHKLIKFYKYAIHYAAGSYDTKYKKKRAGQLPPERWLEMYRRYWYEAPKKETIQKPGPQKNVIKEIQEKPEPRPVQEKTKPVIVKTDPVIRYLKTAKKSTRKIGIMER